MQVSAERVVGGESVDVGPRSRRQLGGSLWTPERKDVMSSKAIRCRSRESAACYQGRDERSIYGEDGQDSDGTWDGETVICDACYITLGQPTRAERSFETGKRPAADMDRADGLGA